MKTKEYKKKDWTKPVVTALNIRKYTFSGTELGPEGAGKSEIPVKS
jgi:hypothetical protein